MAWLLTTWLIFYPFLFPQKKEGRRKGERIIKNHGHAFLLDQQDYVLWEEGSIYIYNLWANHTFIKQLTVTYSIMKSKSFKALTWQRESKILLVNFLFLIGNLNHPFIITSIPTETCYIITAYFVFLRFKIIFLAHSFMNQFS